MKTGETEPKFESMAWVPWYRSRDDVAWERSGSKRGAGGGRGDDWADQGASRERAEAKKPPTSQGDAHIGVTCHYYMLDDDAGWWHISQSRARDCIAWPAQLPTALLAPDAVVISGSTRIARADPCLCATAGKILKSSQGGGRRALDPFVQKQRAESEEGHVIRALLKVQAKALTGRGDAGGSGCRLPVALVCVVDGSVGGSVLDILASSIPLTQARRSSLSLNACECPLSVAWPRAGL